MRCVIFDIKKKNTQTPTVFNVLLKRLPLFYPFRLPLLPSKCFMVLSFSNFISEQFRIKVILSFKMLCKEAISSICHFR